MDHRRTPVLPSRNGCPQRRWDEERQQFHRRRDQRWWEELATGISGYLPLIVKIAVVVLAGWGFISLLLSAVGAISPLGK